jgi:hypothetical protein
MNRRKLIVGSIVAAVAVLGSRFGFANPEDAVIRVLHKRLDYLKLDPDGVRSFATDVQQKKFISRFRLRVIDFAGPLYGETNVSPDGHFGSALRHGEDHVVTQFLISSDFFINGADTSRVVKYRGWFNPLQACGNPFARPVDGITAS